MLHVLAYIMNRRCHLLFMVVFSHTIGTCYKYMYTFSSMCCRVLCLLFPFVYSVVRKMAQYMADILGDEVKERLAENLLVGPSKLPMESFLTRFQWDGAKFPLRQPLPNIVDGISKVGVASLLPHTAVVKLSSFQLHHFCLLLVTVATCIQCSIATVTLIWLAL